MAAGNATPLVAVVICVPVEYLGFDLSWTITFLQISFAYLIAFVVVVNWFAINPVRLLWFQYCKPANVD